MRSRVASCLLVGLAALASPGCFQVSPTGKFMLYVIDGETVGQLELFKADFKSGEVAKLNGEMIDDGDVEQFAIDRKGKCVAYLADQDTDALLELYSVDLKSGDVTKRSPALALGDEIDFFAFDRKGRLLVQFVGIAAGDTHEIWAADLKSNTAGTFRISPTPVVDGSVESIGGQDQVRFMLFTGDMDTDEVVELYRLDFKTFETEKLSADLPLGADVGQFGTDRKGRYAVYLAGADVQELHARNLKSGKDEVINAPLSKGETVVRFEVDPKSRRVVHEIGPSQIVDGSAPSVLHATDLKTGAHVQLTGELVAGGQIQSWTIDETGKFLVYVADEDVDEVRELYKADIVNGGSVKLHPDLPAQADIENVRIDPKGRFVAFTRENAADNLSELFVVKLDDGHFSKVHADFEDGGSILDFRFDPKGRVLVWSGASDDTVPPAIFAFDLKKGLDLGPISGDVVADGLVGFFEVDPTGRRVVFAGTKDDPDVVEFYAVDLKTFEIEKLNAPYVDGGGSPF